MEPTNQNQMNRIVRISITPRMMGMIFQNTKLAICENPIPLDAEFRGIAHDWSRNIISLFYEHDSFSPVPEGGECPEYRLNFKQVEN